MRHGTFYLQFCGLDNVSRKRRGVNSQESPVFFYLNLQRVSLRRECPEMLPGCHPRKMWKGSAVDV